MELKLLIVVVSLVYVGVIIGGYVLTRQQKLRSRDIRRHARKQRVRKQQERITQAQLEKADFQNRLEDFIGEPLQEEQVYISKAEFWQLESDHHRTGTRPPSFFQRLLKRIAKYVKLGKT